MLGRSKMKTARTIVSHLGLLCRFAFRRCLGGLGVVATSRRASTGNLALDVVTPYRELERTPIQ